MPDSMPTATRIEEELRQLRGVTAVRVVLNEEQVQEIHVLATQSRPVKQLVRDIEAVCAARFRLNIDHRVVSIAQIDGPVEEEALQRPRLQGVRVETDGDSVTVGTQLRVGNDVYSGEARGHKMRVGKERLAAEAAIQALEEYLGKSGHLALHDLTRTSLAGQIGFVAVISVLGRWGEEKLIGIALLQGDSMEGAAKAVLDAVNRRLTGGETLFKAEIS